MKKQKLVIFLTAGVLSLLFSNKARAVDYLDHFDANSVNTTIWTITGDVSEANSIVSCKPAADPCVSSPGEIVSVQTFQFEDAEFLLKNLYDQRIYLEYEPLTAGFTGYTTTAGDQYILIRNDIGYGSQRLALEVFKNGTATQIGYVDVPDVNRDAVRFDAHILIYWSAAKLKVVFDVDNDGGTENTFVVTDPNLIPDQPMHFVHHCSQSTAQSDSWDLEFVRVAPIQAIQYSDDFEDGVIDRDLWLLGRGQNVIEANGLIYIAPYDPNTEGSETSNLYSRNMSPQYDSIRFGIRNFYDNRGESYNPLTLGFIGVYRQYHWILLRNDNVSIPNVTGPGLTLWTQDGYGMARYLGYFGTSNHDSFYESHDIDVFIKWESDKITVEFDDLADPGINAVITVTDQRWIPTVDEKGDPLEMFFLAQTLPGGTVPLQLDFVKFGPGCGDAGYMQGDYDNNCVVDMKDFSLLALEWLNPATISDLEAMAADWLECNDPTDPACGL